MPNYRRSYAGTVWFFTVVTHRRYPLFLDPVARVCLRTAVGECRGRFPFQIDAWVLLPDHLHAVWTLPETDTDYSRRWSVIKRRFSQRYRHAGGHGPPYWQMRFWAHRVDDSGDYRHHLDYIHFNPVKHRLVTAVEEWPWSTFHRHVEAGIYPHDWGGAAPGFPPGTGHE
ncbi:MAG: transposase [Chromatiales bacterium]|nr:transposase [Chromatiales bacterium]